MGGVGSQISNFIVCPKFLSSHRFIIKFISWRWLIAHGLIKITACS